MTRLRPVEALCARDQEERSSGTLKPRNDRGRNSSITACAPSGLHGSMMRASQRYHHNIAKVSSVKVDFRGDGAQVGGCPGVWPRAPGKRPCEKEKQGPATESIWRARRMRLGCDKVRSPGAGNQGQPCARAEYAPEWPI